MSEDVCCCLMFWWHPSRSFQASYRVSSAGAGRCSCLLFGRTRVRELEDFEHVLWQLYMCAWLFSMLSNDNYYLSQTLRMPDDGFHASNQDNHAELSRNQDASYERQARARSTDTRSRETLNCWARVVFCQKKDSAEKIKRSFPSLLATVSITTWMSRDRTEAAPIAQRAWNFEHCSLPVETMWHSL